MTHSRSYTSATSNASVATANRQVSNNKVSNNWRGVWRAAWFAILLLGIALRLLRLSWQPLWWDEGYSVYFATEPLPTMLSLTAQDIHPPFYYTLLHFWFALVGNTGAETARLLSVIIGTLTLPIITWASLTLLPKHLPNQKWLALLATLLLAISPIHLYYSQEIRMYGLALLLTLAATTFLWRMQEQLAQGRKPYGNAAGYIITASLALLTLYYTGFILLAHQLWTLAHHRQNWRRQLWFLAAALLILLMQLPWWLYALPKLFVYIGDKVLADQDTSLPIWSYLWRHWLAFFTGHLPSAQGWLETARHFIAALIAMSVILGALTTKWKAERESLAALLSFIGIPLLVGFGVNLYYPFFPEGGERLLLQILPYLLLLFTFVIGKHFTARPLVATVMLALPLLAAIIGTTTLFTTPRYVEHDYRPIIADVIRQGRPNDTVLALFPWQVGYWRAYAPRDLDGTQLTPQPPPVDQSILRWDSIFAARLDSDLATGTIWFPMPLSFGSTLPKEIEDYLASHARNVENHWYTNATRLTAWVQLDSAPQQVPITTTVTEQPTLLSGGIAPTTVASANTPLAIDLCWQPPTQRDDLRATLRLLDAEGQTWASRDLTPLAAYAGVNPDNPCLETIAMNVPVGLPPATYQLYIGVGPEKSDQPLSTLTSIGQITVTAPSEALSPHRLPIEYTLPTPTEDAGLLLLGYTGPGASDELLAGDQVDITLFLQNTNAQPPARELFVSVLDHNGNGVAGRELWPLANYPTVTWSQGALAQAPIQFFLPPNLQAGKYTLIAGFVDPTTGNKSVPATLNPIQIIRRPATFTPPTTQSPITPAPTFGSHATLVGYTVHQKGVELNLELTWQILQPLLPPHAIFVHLLDATGQRIAQTDGEPMTLDGRAPTGSWLSGEYLTTQHTLTLPANAQAPFTLQTGLYLPASGQRLPTIVDGATTGDTATISLPTAP